MATKQADFTQLVGAFRVTDVIYQRLQAQAERLGLPLTHTARYILSEALADWEDQSDCEKQQSGGPREPIAA